MRCKIGTYHRYLFIGWFCLLMFATSQVGHAALKIYYVQVGDAFWENTLWRMDINGENRELFLEPPVPILSPPILSPDGQHLLFTTKKAKKIGQEHESKLMLMNFDGSNLRELLVVLQRHAISGAKWSPDGKRVAYSVADLDRQPIKPELFVMEVEGLNPFQIAPDLEDLIGGFNWFPDSKRLAISIAKPLEHGKLHWIDAARDAKPQAMGVELFANSIHWSPNGERTILTGAMRARGRQKLFLGDALGKNLIPLDAAGEANRVQWLPDSKHIVYALVALHGDVVVVDVAMVNVETQEVRLLTDDGRSQFAFWYDSTLAVEPTGKLSTSWGAIKVAGIDGKK